LRLEIETLGRALYEPVLARMRGLHAAVHRGERPGIVLFVEHEPVYTAGRATSAAELRPGIIPVERGGRITYHGPGQLTVYPIVKLPKRDVRDWLHRLETFGVELAFALGVDAMPSVDGTGVFADGRKLASIGVAVKHWINLHGISINVCMDLAPFRAVRPCGLSPDIMTDLSRALGRCVTIEQTMAAATELLSLLDGGSDPL
jgi:lipoate-protein ligase B